jgi:hypothetical protein
MHDEVLRALIDRDSRLLLTLEPAQRETWDAFPEHTGAEIDLTLRDLENLKRIEGDRRASGYIVWSGLKPTLTGLRHLSEWPPAGEEHLSGEWDQGVWGTRDRPLLVKLRDDPPRHGFVVKGVWGQEDPAAQLKWDAYLRLLAAGLIGADVQNQGLSDVVLTPAGRNVLDPPQDDPLVRARLRLANGAPADAVVATIDEALKPRLQVLAGKASVPIKDLKGNDRKLGNLNDGLKTAGVYPEATRARIDAWLKTRTDVVHPKPGVKVETRDLELLIDGVEEFLTRYPA